jgi:hypothetical protein
MLNKIFAHEILETCLTLGILHAVNDGVAIYKSRPGKPTVLTVG